MRILYGSVTLFTIYLCLNLEVAQRNAVMTLFLVSQWLNVKIKITHIYGSLVKMKETMINKTKIIFSNVLH